MKNRKIILFQAATSGFIYGCILGFSLNPLITPVAGLVGLIIGLSLGLAYPRGNDQMNILTLFSGIFALIILGIFVFLFIVTGHEVLIFTGFFASLFSYSTLLFFNYYIFVVQRIIPNQKRSVNNQP